MIIEYQDSDMLGTCVGWIDEDHDRIYLLPDVSYAAAQELGKAIGDPLTVAPQTLRKRLKEKGYVAEASASRGTTTVRKTIHKKRIEVLALYKASLVTESDQLDQSHHQWANAMNWSSSRPPLVRDRAKNSSQPEPEKPLNHNDIEHRGQVGQKMMREQMPDRTMQSRADPGLSNDSQNLTTQPDQTEPEAPIPTHSTMALDNACTRCQAQHWTIRDGHRICMNCQYQDTIDGDDDVVSEEVF